MKSRNEIDVKAIAETVIDDVYHQFAKQNEYYLVAHSFGTITALKIASMLEKRGKSGHIILIDGSPHHIHRLADGLSRTVQSGDQENDLILIIVAYFCSTHDIASKLVSCNSLSAKMELVSDFILAECKINYSKQYLCKMIGALLSRLKLVMKFDFEKDEMAGILDKPLKASITLVKPTQASCIDIAEDYHLSKFTEQNVNIKYLDGNHLTVLENTELINILNEITVKQTIES